MAIDSILAFEDYVFGLLFFMNWNFKFICIFK